jgi:hypothetical protein
MALVINTNIASVTAQRHLTESRADMERPWSACLQVNVLIQQWTMLLA